jgi:hypothetical protein
MANSIAATPSRRRRRRSSRRRARVRTDDLRAWPASRRAGSGHRRHHRPDAHGTLARGDHDDLALEQGPADGVDRHDLGQAVALAGDEQGAGIDHRDIGDLRIGDDHRGSRAAQLHAGSMVNLDRQGPGLGTGRLARALSLGRRRQNRQGREGDQDAAHEDLSRNRPRARAGTPSNCAAILKKG